ncbi:MAG: hypothetical protein ACKOEI_07785, partial [Chthoniobacterales bacterium]
AKRGLGAVFYGLGAVEGGKAPQTQTELLAWLKKAGLPVVPKFWEAEDEAGVRKAIAALETIRHDFAFETDGAVIKLDEFKRREQTGSTSKAPRWAMAYKYEAERARTKLNSITVQVGRMGTRCRTCLKPSSGLPATRWVGESGVRKSGCASSRSRNSRSKTSYSRSLICGAASS